MSKEAMKLALEAAYLAGFNASGEGYNGEYPFGDKNQNPEADAVWVKDRDNTIREALAEQPAQKRPQNCGTGYCSCIECVMEPAQQEPVAYMGTDSDGNPNKFRLNPFSGCVSLYEKPSPVQKPVAYMDICEKNQMSGLRYWSEPDNRHEVPLYTSPPAQRKPLTDEEIVQIELGLRQYNNRDTYDLSLKDFARAIEAKLKEKNT